MAKSEVGEHKSGGNHVPHNPGGRPQHDNTSWLAVTTSEQQHEHETNDRGRKRRRLLSPVNGSEDASSCAVQTASNKHRSQSSTRCDDSPTRLSSVQVCFGMLTVRLRPSEECSVASGAVNANLLREVVVASDNHAIKFGSLPLGVKIVIEQLLAHKDVDVQLVVVRGSKKATAHDLLVILYAPRMFAEDIADFLDGNNLFLQTPKFCDRSVCFENPQAFLQTSGTTTEQHTKVRTDVRASDIVKDRLADLESGLTLPEAVAPSALRTTLLGHQKQALTFMLLRESDRPRPDYDLWRRALDRPIFQNVISEEVVMNEPIDFYGGILADQMGLGKSLSAIALVASDRDRGITEPTLIVVRAALLETWRYELTTHLYPNTLHFKIHHGKSRIRCYGDLVDTNVVLSTYHTLMAEKKKHASLPQIMFGKHWHRVVLDEAHDIRDDKSIMAEAICALNSRSRWALTGTPLQNDLSDIASLFKFVQVHPYNDPQIFKWQISVLASKYGDDRARYLLKLVMLRRSINSVQLPQRQDLDIRLRFCDEEQHLYDRVKVRAKEAWHMGAQRQIFATIHKLLMICNLGAKVKVSDDAVDEEWSPSTAQAIFDELETADKAICRSCAANVISSVTEAADTLAGQDNRPFLAECRELLCGPCWQKGERCGHSSLCSAFAVSTLGSSLPAAQNALLEDVHKPSTKITALMQDLTEHQHKEKSAIFSSWTTTLDMIEHELIQKGILFIRIDGTVPQKTRDRRLKAFKEDTAIRVVLITMSCGSVGLDLTAASRAYLMEPRWNPSIEQQALARVYRMGQRRPVTTIRYIMSNSLEEHVLNVQRRKKELSELLMPQNATADSIDRLQDLSKYL